MIREELSRLGTWSERHERLLARVLIAAALSLVVDFVGALLMWRFEIHGFGNALFFTTAQVLTVSSSMQNPVTHAGQIVDVCLELWAVVVVSAVAGSFASFFLAADK
ncbi:MAG: voltage-gated potassium channel [Gaiellaceae bacterium]|nr:voltage-gated potassium channel [Gaiellaceae bacterium]